MTRMLASVSSLEEVALVLDAAVDIIDLKEPASGALGALEIDLVKQIVEYVQKRCPISATIGDLPMHPELILRAVKAMAETGVDFIKIGFFPGGDWNSSVKSLLPLIQNGTNLIAVLFADNHIDLNCLSALKNAGFKGVMLDTMTKQSGSLTQVMSKTHLDQFVELAKKHQFICGLAGSLKLEDIPILKKLKPDYLGFRGALCLNKNRTAKLDSEAIVQIKNALK
jgi:uncharacterized protein (UPF0264 family)